MAKELKSIPLKKTDKKHRERNVLLGLVEFYLKTGKPVGSNTLKEAGFEELSSATIRNYFASLEEQGMLRQQHISGGRIPTEKAIKIYTQEYLHQGVLDEISDQEIKKLRDADTKEIATYLQNAAERLSVLTNCAVFFSAPRLDHDFVIDLKILPIDANRCLGVIVSDFGTVQSEILYTKAKISSFAAKRIESYFQWRLTGHLKPENLEVAEEKLAQEFYNELMVRYIVGYTHFINEEIYRTGFSRLLAYPELHDATALASTLSIFENVQSMRKLLRETLSFNDLKCWIGEDLNTYTPIPTNCAVLAVPYSIHQNPVGGLGILGPIRLPYRQLFAILQAFSQSISACLTRNIYKHRIQFRQPQPTALTEPLRLSGQTKMMLIEDKGKIL